MRLAGERQRHHGAAVERIFESDDAGTSGGGARDLHGVFDRLGAGVHEQRLLRKVSGRELVQSLRKPD